MIKGVSVQLRALERRDLAKLWEWENDAEVMEFASSSPERCVSLDILTRMFESGVSSDSFPKRYIIEEKEHGAIGMISYWLPNPKFFQSAEIGVYIGEKNLWGKGYGTDAILALARALFEELNFHRISFSVGGHNTRMQKVLERCGMKLEGIIREERYIHGRYWDTIKLGCLKHEFEEESRRGVRQRHDEQPGPSEDELHTAGTAR